jgi:hypothetical protein
LALGMVPFTGTSYIRGEKTLYICFVFRYIWLKLDANSNLLSQLDDK